MVILGHNLGNSQVSVYRTIGPTLVYVSFPQVVEKTDLLGRDFIWEICLNTPDETIADNAIQLLLGISYTNLNSKLKKVPLYKLYVYHFMKQKC